MQHHSCLPLFAFPNSVVLIDDNAALLKSIRLLFPPYVNSLHFLNPREAVNNLPVFLTKSPADFLAKNQLSTFSHLTDIFSLIHEPNRFSEVTVIFSDYAMPGMNGLALFETLASYTLVKKVLFTGIADPAIALKQSAQRVQIDHVLTKSGVGLIDDLLKVRAQLVEHYFAQLSLALIDSIDAIYPAILADPKWITIFYDICKAHRITEYYVLDETGSMLLADVAGNLKALVVYSQTELLKIAECAAAQHAPESIQTALSRGKHVPYFPPSLSFARDASTAIDWSRACLHDAIPFSNETETYFYSLVDDPVLPESEKTPVFFETYRRGKRSS